VNLKAAGVHPPLNFAFKVRLQANTQVHPDGQKRIQLLSVLFCATLNGLRMKIPIFTLDSLK